MSLQKPGFSAYRKSMTAHRGSRLRAAPAILEPAKIVARNKYPNVLTRSQKSGVNQLTE
ncbi:hypothetical protein MnTg04_00734 [bacterium MnTg04]|nr:hypothetical protein MnTg04_00734 [bacterium MnTg04]